MFDALLIQYFLGLYFIGVGLPSAVSPAPAAPARKPFSDFAQLVFGLVLTGISIAHIVLVK